MSDIFLSYAEEDREDAARMADLLEMQGWKVFWDREIPIGGSWPEVLDTELPRAKVITPLWSPAANASRWVQREATYGDTHQKLIPAMIKKTEAPIAFSLIQYADLTKWDRRSGYDRELERLFVAVERRIGHRRRRAEPPQIAPRKVFEKTGQSAQGVFLAYKRSDRDTAEQLVQALEQRGFAIWWDPQIPIGASFQDTVVGALEESAVTLALWTPNSLESAWLRAEAEWALSHSKLVNATLSVEAAPLGFAVAPTTDLSTWDGSPDHPAFTHLLHTISLSTKEPAPATQTTEHDRMRKRRRISFVIVAAIVIFLAGLAAGGFLLEVLMQRRGP